MLNKYQLNLVKGKSELLIATIMPSNANEQLLKWESSNTKVAHVDSQGQVTAEEIGNSIITVSTLDGKITARATVVVDYEKSDWSNHWGKDNIRKAMDKGWVDKSTTFRPNDAINRAEFIKIVNKAFGYTEVGSESFDDVNEKDWFYKDICIAMKAGYINGKSPTKFDPESYITREEVAKIATTIMNNTDTDYDKISGFTDAKDVSDWAKPYVEGALEAGYLKGNPGNTIKPQGQTTRAESVVILGRMK